MIDIIEDKNPNLTHDTQIIVILYRLYISFSDPFAIERGTLNVIF